jgi:hypothetical protein
MDRGDAVFKMKGGRVHKAQKLQGQTRAVLEGLDDLFHIAAGLQEIAELKERDLVSVEFFVMDDVRLCEVVALKSVETALFIFFIKRRVFKLCRNGLDSVRMQQTLQ